MNRRNDSFRGSARTALAQRLGAAAKTLKVSVRRGSTAEETAALALLGLVRAVRPKGERAEFWLLFVAISTVYPHERDLAAVADQAERLRDEEFADWILEYALARGDRDGQLGARLDIVEGAIVIDVTYAATNDHNSGVQRVVRSAAPHWATFPGVIFAADAGDSGALRPLARHEADRVLRWGEERSVSEEPPSTVLVPWHARILFPEVPAERRMPGLGVFASLPVITAIAIGHDAIPITGREFVSGAEMRRYGGFLSIVEQLELIIGVSESAAAEFDGLARMFRPDGDDRPRATVCALPVITAALPPGEGVRSGPPLVLVVGSKEPRKNQDSVLFASELLWREGFRFELLMVGVYGWSTRLFRRWLSRVRKAGRPVHAPASFSDAELWSAYSRASFSVFPSFLEGFGLPVAESLSHGVPAITSNYGSMAEIASGGGCLVVDPRDDNDVVDAMRRLLSDPVLRDELSRSAQERPVDSWLRYASETMALVMSA